MKKIKAFTFIELLVVSAILVLIAGSSVFYFFRFLDSSRLNNWVNDFKDYLESLDKKVRDKDILDYKLFLKKNSLYSYAYFNTLNLDNLLIFTWAINYETWSWKLELYPNWTSTWAFKIEVYANNKFLKDYFISWDSSFDYSFSKFKNYKVSWTYSWQILNFVNIRYFSKLNLDHKKQNYLRLIKIDTDKSSDLDQIFIQNILWRKKFSDNNNSNILKLTFDFNWKQKILEIKK